MWMRWFVPLWLVLCLAIPALAGKADVIDATTVRQPDGRYRFEVTVQHSDHGWDHYADRWQVLSPEGKVMATRTLYHPHVEEQPFTRGLSDVAIPAGVDRVVLRAHDSMHGEGGRTLTVALPGRP